MEEKKHVKHIMTKQEYCYKFDGYPKCLSIFWQKWKSKRKKQKPRLEKGAPWGYLSKQVYAVCYVFRRKRFTRISI